MGVLLKKVYKGAEFSEGFKMDRSRFDDIYGKCHIFNKMEAKNKSIELAAAFEVANSTPSVSGPKLKK